MTNDQGAATGAGTPTSDEELSAPAIAVDKHIGSQPKQQATGTDVDDPGGFGCESATATMSPSARVGSLNTRQSRSTFVAHHTVSQPNVPAAAVDRNEMENTTAKSLDEKDVISSPSVDREVWEVKRDATVDVACHNERRDTSLYPNNETADDSQQTDVSESGGDAQSADSDADNSADLMPERKRSYTRSELQEGRTSDMKESAVNTIQSKKTSDLKESAVNTIQSKRTSDMKESAANTIQSKRTSDLKEAAVYTIQSKTSVESLKRTTSSSSLTTSTPSGKKIPYADDGSVQFGAVSVRPSRENISIMNDRFERHRPETELWPDDDTDIDLRISDELENTMMASNDVEIDDDTSSLMSQLRQLSIFADQKQPTSVQSSRQPPSEEQTSSLMSHLRQLSSFADQKPLQTLTTSVQSSRQPPSKEQTTSLMSQLRQLCSFADQNPPQTLTSVQSSRQPPSEEQTPSLMSQLRQLSSIMDQKPPPQTSTTSIQSSRQPPFEERTTDVSRFHKVPTSTTSRPLRGRGRTYDQPTSSATTKTARQFEHNVTAANDIDVDDDNMSTASLLPRPKQLTSVVDQKPSESSLLPRQLSRVVAKKSPQTLLAAPVQSPPKKSQSEERTKRASISQKVVTSTTSKPSRGVAGHPTRGKTYDRPTISASAKMAGPVFTWNQPSANDDNDNDDDSVTNEADGLSAVRGTLYKPQLDDILSVDESVDFDAPAVQPKTTGSKVRSSSMSAGRGQPDTARKRSRSGRRSVADDILSVDGSVDFDAPAVQPETTGSKVRSSSMSSSRGQPDTARKRSRSDRRSVADDILSVDGSVDFDAPAVQPEKTGSQVRSSSISASRRQPDTAGKRSRSGSKSAADIRDNRLKDTLTDDLQFLDTNDQVPTRKRSFSREISQLAARLKHTGSEQAGKSSDSRQRGGSRSSSTAGRQRGDGGGQQSVEDVYVEAMSLDAEGRVSGQSSIEWREELARIIDSLRHQLRSREKTVGSRKSKICLLTADDLEEFRNFTQPKVRRKSKR